MRQLAPIDKCSPRRESSDFVQRHAIAGEIGVAIRDATPTIGSVVRAHHKHLLTGSHIADGAIGRAILPSLYAIIRKERRLTVAEHIGALSGVTVDNQSHIVFVVVISLRSGCGSAINEHIIEKHIKAIRNRIPIISHANVALERFFQIAIQNVAIFLVAGRGPIFGGSTGGVVGVNGDIEALGDGAANRVVDYGLHLSEGHGVVAIHLY